MFLSNGNTLNTREDYGANLDNYSVRRDTLCGEPTYTVTSYSGPWSIVCR